MLDAPATATLHALTLTAGPHGTAGRWPDRISYAQGTTVTLYAIPDPRWHFTRWSGALPAPSTATLSTIVVTMDRDRTIHAAFGATFFVLSTSAVGNGTVQRAPDEAGYLAGDLVMLTALPDRGWRFRTWTGDAPPGHSCDNPLAVTVATTTTLTAHFVPEASTWMVH